MELCQLKLKILKIFQLKILKQLQKRERLLKKILLEKLVKELDLTKDDLKDFEKAREEAWKEEKNFNLKLF